MSKEVKIAVFSLIAIITTHALIVIGLQYRLKQDSLSQNEARLRLNQYKDP